jgi:cytochrome c oxidase subunit 2
MLREASASVWQRACRFRVPVAALIAGLASGCQGVQSALDPAADEAARLAALSWSLFLVGTVIFVGVMLLLLHAVFGDEHRRRWLGHRRTVIAGGLVFPVVTLSALLTFGLVLLRDTNAASEDHALRIEVIGEQYWWRVRYGADGGQPAFATANELRVPIGRPVALAVTSADVIHAIWIPNFAGKIDMIPGRVNTLRFTAEREGVYRGVCTEFCGDQHTRMAFDVVALSPPTFETWRKGQAADAREPGTPLQEFGKVVFARGGCGSCHAVRGTDAQGRLGPDLTHVGGRRTIGAGTYPTNAGTLAGWIADTQHLKPGARMPSYSSFSGEELRAVASYLDYLK